MAIPPAPSAPPTSVSVSEVTSSSITVQWGPVDCIDHNGDITGYSVQYGEVEGDRVVMMVEGDMNRRATISDLTPSTEYTVSVAAVNSAGTGMYSNEIVPETEGKNIFYTYTLLDNDSQMHCHRC